METGGKYAVENPKKVPAYRRVRLLHWTLLASWVCLLGVLVALIVVASIKPGEAECDSPESLAADQVTQNTTTTTTQQPTQAIEAPCTTAECVSVSAAILENMNTSVDPCEDLYTYACGRWLDQVILPPGYPRLSRFGELRIKTEDMVRALLEADGQVLGGQNSSAVAKAKTVYANCMDEEGVEANGVTSMLGKIDELGSWTVTTAGIKTWNNDTWDLQTAMVETKKIQVSSFLGVTISTDDKNNTKNILTFYQSGLLLSASQYTDNKTAGDFKEAYLEYGSKMAELLGGEKDAAREKLEDVWNFEKKLAEIFVRGSRDPEKRYNKMTVADLQNKTGTWIDLVRCINEAFLNMQLFTSESEILVITPDYFEKLGPVIEGTDKEVLANYLMFRLVLSHVAFLPEDFAKAYLPLQKQLRGVASLKPRWERCLQETRDMMELATGAMFVEQHFSLESRERVRSILRGIQQTFIENLNDVAWLDDETRGKLREKAENVRLMVGFPDWILDPARLDEKYKNLTIESGNFFDNGVRAIEYRRDQAIADFSKPQNTSEWFGKPDEVNAFYSPTSNAIVIPAGILQPPFFNPDYPDAMLYGTIGMVVGHELTHGFDNSGRYYDKDGNMADSMWTPQAAEGFKERSQCLVDQFSNYTILGQHLNGKLTLGENIADSGGIKFGFRAYSQKEGSSPRLPALGLTDDQLFFVGFSQQWCNKRTDEVELQLLLTNVHTTPKFRVIGTLHNSDDFARAFNCPKKPESGPKCTVW